MKNNESAHDRLERFFALRNSPVVPALTPEEEKEITRLEAEHRTFRFLARPYGERFRKQAKKLLFDRAAKAKDIQEKQRLTSELGIFESVADSRWRLFQGDVYRVCAAAATVLLPALERELARAREHRAALGSIDLTDLDLDHSRSFRDVDNTIGALQRVLERCDSVRRGDHRGMTPEDMARPFGFDFSTACERYSIPIPQDTTIFAGVGDDMASFNKHCERHHLDFSTHPGHLAGN